MPSRRRQLRRLRRRSRPLLLVLLAASLLVLTGVALVAVTLPGLKGDLDDARRALTRSQDALRDADLDGARKELATARTKAKSANDTSNNPAWRTMSRLPAIGPVLQEARGITRALDATTDQVLPRLLMTDLRPKDWTGRLDTAPLARASPDIARAEQELNSARDRLRRTTTSDVGPLSKARRELTDDLDRLATTVREARIATKVLPRLAGTDRPRRFFLAVQNNAEPRATGGLIGAYGILRTDKGRITLERIGSNTELKDQPRAAIDLGPEHTARYGRFQSTRTWRSANLSPDLPTVGATLTALWRAQTGERLDGALLLDPVGLGLLLGATGPVTLDDGTRLTEANAVKVLLADTYVRFPREQDQARNASLQETARRAIGRLTSPGLDGTRLAQRFGRAATSGHLQVWAAEPALQAELVQARVGGALPTSGPYLEVLTQDVGGSKLAYYQRRAVTYDARPTGERVDLGAGPEAEEQATVTVRLTSTAPRSGLPDYVTLRPDDPRAPTGQAKTLLSVYLGPRATLLSATLDGRPVEVESGTERGLTVLTTPLTLDAGQTRALVLTVRQPARPDQPLRWRQQPLVVEDDLVVRRDGSPRPLDRVYAQLAP